MSEREHYPAGVPCWVDTLQPDPQAAVAFYGALFGWEFVGPGPMPGDPPGEYFVARLAGRDVAGIGSAPAGDAAAVTAWSTHILLGDGHDTRDALVSTHRDPLCATSRCASAPHRCMHRTRGPAEGLHGRREFCSSPRSEDLASGEFAATPTAAKPV